MDLRQLNYFITVAEEGNIGRAARRLYISQPPLTRQIHQLEEELGVELFIRTPRGVELTQAGEELLEQARNIRSLVELTVERTQRAGQGRLGRLDIGIFGSSIMDLIPQILLAFRNRYPDVKIVLHTMTKGQQIEALRQGRISVGFNRMLTPADDITVVPVAEEGLRLALPVDHPLAALDVIPFTALRGHPMVLFPSGARPNFIDKIMALCSHSGFEPEISQEVGDAVTGLALVASGFGICLVPEAATTLQLPNIIYRELTETPPNFSVDVSLIHRADDRSPVLSAFLDVIAEFKRDRAQPDRG